MLILIKPVLIVMSLCCIVSFFEEGEVIAQPFEQPITIRLDFLNLIKKDVNWLREELTLRHLTKGFTVENGCLTTSELKIIRFVNRIRSFCHLDTFNIQPYFSLKLRDRNNKHTACVTENPRSIIPQLKSIDFRQAEFSSENADATGLDLCRVTEQPDAVFKGVTRTAFRENFFDKYGDLKIEFVELNQNTAFIATAIDLGFFVFNQDVTGRLRIDI